MHSIVTDILYTRLDLEHVEERAMHCIILCSWFRASFIYINNCLTRCNTKQSIYYSASYCKCFGRQPHPSLGVHKTVTTASGTGHIFCAATSLQRGQAWLRWREVTVAWGDRVVWNFKPAYHTVAYIEWHTPEVVLIQLTLLMMSTCLLETCRELE